MQQTRIFKLALPFLIALAALSGQAFASSVAVGLCAAPGTHYTTIQAAVTAASPGATVRVCPGTYPEQVLITKNLTLLGIAAGVNDAAVVTVPVGGLAANGSDIFGNPVAAQIFVMNATVTVSHITVDGSNNGLASCATDPIGIYYQNAGGSITDSVARNQLMDPAYQGCQVGLAINVEGGDGSPAVTISNNSVRNYDKNGITASGPGNGGGPNVTVSSNTVIGLGPTNVIAQNGIQIGYGATGLVTGNEVVDDIYANPPCGGNNQPPCYGSSGILIYASEGVTVSSNTVESTQLGIAPTTDPTYGTANNTTIRSNHVGGTQIYDAIDLCSDNNVAQSNFIYGSAQSGIHLDDECPPSQGNNNTVTGNTINEACAGILLGTGTGNTTTPNTFLNDTNTTLSGDTCTPLDSPAKSSGKHVAFRPSPFTSIRK